jgi:type IV secretory pathway TrbL component
LFIGHSNEIREDVSRQVETLSRIITPSKQTRKRHCFQNSSLIHLCISKSIRVVFVQYSISSIFFIVLLYKLNLLSFKSLFLFFVVVINTFSELYFLDSLTAFN